MYADDRASVTSSGAVDLSDLLQATSDESAFDNAQLARILELDPASKRLDVATIKPPNVGTLGKLAARLCTQKALAALDMAAITPVRYARDFHDTSDVSRANIVTRLLFNMMEEADTVIVNILSGLVGALPVLVRALNASGTTLGGDAAATATLVGDLVRYTSLSHQRFVATAREFAVNHQMTGTKAWQETSRSGSIPEVPTRGHTLLETSSILPAMLARRKEQGSKDKTQVQVVVAQQPSGHRSNQPFRAPQSHYGGGGGGAYGGGGGGGGSSGRQRGAGKRHAGGRGGFHNPQAAEQEPKRGKREV